MAECLMCDKEFDEEEMEYILNDHGYCCCDCLEKHYYRCDQCEEYYQESDMAVINGSFNICDFCRDANNYKRDIEKQHNTFNDIDDE